MKTISVIRQSTNTRLADSLNQVPADSNALLSLTHPAQWNVEGRDFFRCTSPPRRSGRSCWKNLPTGVKKQHLPKKRCAACGRPFNWRKKWERVWDEVKYCSDRCRMVKGQARAG